MIQITCVKTLFSNIFHQKQDKIRSSKRHLSELEDLEKYDFVIKKPKVEENPKPKKKSSEPQKEEVKENFDDMTKEKKKVELEVEKILEKFKGVLLISFESAGEMFYKFR